MKILNSVTCPIENKVSLIEASAGTGKTYNIQNLFVRMIMEKNFPVESILVVTFTDAATRELKARIRSILTDLTNYFEKRAVHDMERVKQLTGHGTEPDTRKYQRVVKALRDFDKSSIFTIHGFCKKALDENSFATASFFNQELQKNYESVIEKIVQNFFRKYFYQNSPFENLLNSYHKIDYSKCLTFIRAMAGKTTFKFTIEYDSFDLHRQLSPIVKKLRDCYDRERITGKLSKKVVSQAKTKYNPAELNRALDAAEDFFKDKVEPDTFSLLTKFTNEAINNSLLKNKKNPGDPFFDAMDELIAILHQYKYATYQQLYRYFQQEFEKEKRHYGFRTFDDLIRVLENYLHRSPRLRDKIGDSFEAVLIDEFQDTDALQYSIFHKIFIEQNKPTFLIGDPKQAIYSFRGGDIYAYKRAKEEVRRNNGNLYTLLTNYRSTPEMVAAINEFYGSLPPDKVFFNDFIEFHPVSAQDQQGDKLLTAATAAEKTLDIFYNGHLSNIPDSNRFAVNITLLEIHKLLSDESYELLEKGHPRRILPSDIAILVNQHLQADLLLPYLREAGIPAVIQATGSVYDSHEAEALHLLLKAIDEPNNIKAIAGALTSFLFDVTAEDLYKMVHEDADAMNEWIFFFRNCHSKWQKGSFIECFNFIMSERKIKPYVLSQPEGDRKITNLLHLQELIQQKEQESSLGISGIVNWFQMQLDPDRREEEGDIELRLETDDNALKIMTVHKSKGLEFPIVFAPFFWSQKYSSDNKEFIEYHDDQNDRVIDLEKKHIQQAEAENLEEQIRLVYVALTRAKYKASVVAVNNKNLAALKYFLTQFNNQDDSAILSMLKTNIPELKDFSGAKRINFIEPDIAGPVRLKYSSGDISRSQPPINHRFHGRLDYQWQINSFSSLLRGNLGQTDGEIKDVDQQESQPELPEETELNIFTFPAGAKVGSCWHEIFEEIEFHHGPAEIEKVASEKLSVHGILAEEDTAELRQKYIDITTAMVTNVLLSKLSTEPEILLSSIPSEKRITELEFLFSLKDTIDQQAINDLLSGYNIQFNHPVPAGFLNGFIDLVFESEGKFYILDWKSNALGTSIQDFSADNIRMEMKDHNYYLQYLIYSVALHKYLQQRLPDYSYSRHFGGVFYIFLRGVRPNSPGSGVFYDFPKEKLIYDLNKLLT